MAEILEDLTDEECALYALLQDPSGIDQAEFLIYDPSSEDKTGCFRCWAFQWAWFRNRSPFQVDQSARAMGKSLSIKLRAMAFPLVYPGQEMAITAPELVHLEPIASLIESQFYATRLLRDMLPHNKSAITHRPFQMNFVNGGRIIGRIPQRDGRGVKGLHPLLLEQDEAQDYPHAGWVELTETLKRGVEGAQWRAHGVTRGLRDDFYEITQDTPDNEWKVHRYPAQWRPNWSDQERQEKIKKYGSREDPDYRRNVLGLHGDTTNPIFVLHKLMACVSSDIDPHSTEEYHLVEVKSETLQAAGRNILDVIQPPSSHLSYAGRDPSRPKAKFWAGTDIGFTIDPSEIVVFVEYIPKGSDVSKLKLLTRIQMVRMGHHEQVAAIISIINFYRPRAFSMDKGGVGLPLFQDIQQQAQENPALKHVLDSIKGYNFSEKSTVEFDSSVTVSEYADAEEIMKQTAIKRNVKEASTDVMRTLVDNGRVELPWDRDLLRQLQGGTWTNTRGYHDQYGRKRFSGGDDHILDAIRFAIHGWAQYGIEEQMKHIEPEPVYDYFVSL